MAELDMNRICWECVIQLNVDSQVAESLNAFLNEISTFNRQVKEINFPRPESKSCCQSWKIQSKMKLFVFSKCRNDLDSFLKWSFLERFEEKGPFLQRTMLKTWNEVSEALKHTKRENYFVLPIVLISVDDLMENEPGKMINFAEDLIDIVNILRQKWNDVPIVLTFKPSSKTDMQSIINVLDTDHSKSIPVVFSKDDVMFRGYLVRKMKDWMHTHYEKVMRSAEKWLQDLKKVPTCADVENCLNSFCDTNSSEATLKEFTFLDLENAISKHISTRDKQAYQRLIRNRAVVELCKKTIDVSFDVPSHVDVESSSCLRMYLVNYFQSFMTGMMVCIVHELEVPSNYSCHSPEWSQHEVILVLQQVKNNWQNCMKDYLNDEIMTVSKLIVILQKDFIPKLYHFTKTCEVHDEVPYEVQIRLARMPGIRSFGIEDKKFIVYVDSPLLEEDGLLPRLKRSVEPHHDVNRLSLLAWKEPVFHHRIGELIEGEDNKMGMITTFAERVDSNGNNPSHDLYFITCEHVAPREKMRVFFLKCLNCQSRQVDCDCEKEELGINMYPFGSEKENPFDAVVDITCGIVNKKTSSFCDTTVCVPHCRPFKIVDFSTTIETHTGKPVLKWDCDGNQRRGEYCGVQYTISLHGEANESLENIPKRVDLIKTVDGHSFGREGHSGALIFLMENEGGAVDVMSPAFVYLGQWANNKFMCFRLQEGIQCLEMEHKLKLRLCLGDPSETNNWMALS